MHRPVFQRWAHTQTHTEILRAPAVQLRGAGDSLNPSTHLVSVSALPPPLWVLSVFFTPPFNIPCASSRSLLPLLFAHLASPLTRRHYRSLLLSYPLKFRGLILKIKKRNQIGETKTSQKQLSRSSLITVCAPNMLNVNG